MNFDKDDNFSKTQQELIQNVYLSFQNQLCKNLQQDIKQSGGKKQTFTLPKDEEALYDSQQLQQLLSNAQQLKNEDNIPINQHLDILLNNSQDLTNNDYTDDSLSSNVIDISELFQQVNQQDQFEQITPTGKPTFLNQFQPLSTDWLHESSDSEEEIIIQNNQQFQFQPLQDLFQLKKQIHEKCMQQTKEGNIQQVKQDIDQIFQEIEQETTKLQNKLKDLVQENQNLEQKTYDVIKKHNCILQQYKQNTFKIQEAKEFLSFIQQKLNEQMSKQYIYLILNDFKKQQIEKQHKQNKQ